MIELDKIYNEDCLEGMKRIDDGAVDCIITDLPYGTTACAWDSVIPFEPLWEQFKRVTKPNAAIVLFGREPFSTTQRMSNIKDYRYDWIWVKSQGVNFVQVNKMPLQKHELISVFIQGGNGRIYNPQGLRKCYKVKSNGNGKFGSIVSDKGHSAEYVQQWENYPDSLLYFDNDPNPDHPTQKPVDLLRYLILTYSNEGDTILDATIGSGTTAVAALMEHRHFIGFETNKEYFDIAQGRIDDIKRQPTLF